jgi:Flp pilus assembly protein TadB
VPYLNAIEPLTHRKPSLMTRLHEFGKSPCVSQCTLADPSAPNLGKPLLNLNSFGTDRRSPSVYKSESIIIVVAIVVVAVIVVAIAVVVVVVVVAAVVVVVVIVVTC